MGNLLLTTKTKIQKTINEKNNYERKNTTDLSKRKTKKLKNFYVQVKKIILKI